MQVPRNALGISGLIVAFALAACHGKDNSGLDLAVIDGQADVADSKDLPGLANRLVEAATAEGLVAFDEQGRVIPALADRWIVTDDGQSYIFRLRDGDWPDGDELTADSARKALEATLRTLRGTPMALDLSGIEQIRVMAGRVIEIRLNRPMPYLLQLLAQPELGLEHKKRGAGPMTAAREGALVKLSPIEPSMLGMPAVENWHSRTRELGLHVLTGAEAVQEFNDGVVDLVLGGHIQDFLLTRSVGILRGTIQLDPVVGLFGLQVMNDKGFLADPANREALAMAIDREALIAPFGVGGWSPTTRIVSPSLDGDLGTIGERWSEQSLDERRTVAAARVRAWMAAQAGNAGMSGHAAKSESKPSKPAPARPAASSSVSPVSAAGGEAPGQSGSLRTNAPRLTVWLPQGEGSQLLFARLAADFAAISVRLERVEDADAADLTLVDDVASYPRAAWYLNRLSCSTRHGLCSADADARVAEAAKTAAPQDRAALLTEAEAELTAANVFIPFGTPIRWSLVRGSVSGFATNSWGWHPLMPLSWLPK